MSSPLQAGPEVGALPTRDELVQRMAALRPLLQEDAALGDRDRVLTPRVVDAMTEAGVFRLMTPKRLSGYEADILTLLDVVAELGRGDLSAAWVAGVLCFSGWQIGAFGDQVQREVWDGNPDTRVCSVISAAVEQQPADGGIVMSGRWPAASGSEHSEWAVLTVPTSFGPQGPVFSIAVVPMSDLTIEDTWYPAGVRGSASNTLVGQDVFVPAYRLMGMREAMAGERLTEHTDEALYRSSFAGIASIATLAPQLGAAQAVLDDVLAKSRGRMIPAAAILDQSEAPAFQMRVAEAAIKIDAALLLARQAAAETDEAATRGGLPTDRARGFARIAAAWASQQVYEAVETLMSEAGASGFMDDASLQRMWRDVSVAHRHTAYRLDPVLELYGRILLDKGPGQNMLF